VKPLEVASSVDARVVVETTDLTLDYASRGRGKRTPVRAVDKVNLTIRHGEILGVVGESGSGKSTLARCIVALLRPTSGEVRLDGVDVHASGAESRRARTQMQMVFQDPTSSLDPRKTVEYSVAEPLRVLGRPWRQEVKQILDDVGLPASVLSRYPHELSGGQQQRVGIARALVAEPRLVIHDEPVSSLDVSLQAQIVNILLDLQASRHATYMFISHDLGVVQAISSRVVVMYRGRIVERGPTAAIMRQPLHPYTFALVGSVPSLDPEEARAWLAAWVPGQILQQAEQLTGCRFRDRCPMAQEVCQRVEPDLVEERSDHWVACHFPGSMSTQLGDGASSERVATYPDGGEAKR
jgi:oligopeptide transport system ATP-binding protein